MTDKVFERVITELNNAGASMRCGDLTALLVSLGFSIKDGRKGGHKVFTHDHLASFSSGSYNCDHGRNPEIKKPYILKVKKTLMQHESEIRAHLKE